MFPVRGGNLVVPTVSALILFQGVRQGRPDVYTVNPNIFQVLFPYFGLCYGLPYLTALAALIAPYAHPALTRTKRSP